jgi:hypothetical protein
MPGKWIGCGKAEACRVMIHPISSRALPQPETTWTNEWRMKIFAARTHTAQAIPTLSSRHRSRAHRRLCQFLLLLFYTPTNPLLHLLSLLPLPHPPIPVTPTLPPNPFGRPPTNWRLFPLRWRVWMIAHQENIGQN